MMTARGITSRLLESPSGGPPAVYGELRAPGATKTVVFYAHYDGQPVDTTQWATPPWRPVLRDKALDAAGQAIAIPAAGGSIQPEWRLYARSASDDKAPIVAMFAALDALRAAHVSPSVNLKFFFFEGEEEAGSGHLRELLERNAALLKADAWLFCDGPVHQSRRQQIVFGVRGVTGARPKRRTRRSSSASCCRRRISVASAAAPWERRPRTRFRPTPPHRSISVSCRARRPSISSSSSKRT